MDMKKKKCLALAAALLVGVGMLTGITGCQKESKAEKEESTQKPPESGGDKTEPVDSTPFAEGEYALTVKTLEQGVEISDTLYGLFFEDINFAGDGGLYAEMVKNRSFEFEDKTASNGGLHGYRSIEGAVLTVHSETPLHPNNLHYVQIENTTGSPAGLSNAGFLEGMTIQEGAEYRFTVYLKSDSYSGAIRVQLSNTSGKILAEQTIQTLSGDWTKYEVLLTASETAEKGKLLLLLEEDGIVDADMVSLFPVDTYHQRENGLRADLVAMLEELQPSFLRFPGGCVVEGNSLDSVYCWKDTVGDVAERKQNINIWNSNSSNPYYQSYGLGFYEYFLLCEDLGAEPVPILNCGMACQVRTNQNVPIDQLDPYIQDALDLIEFANGDATTQWGALRANMGHPEPFGLHYLGIGNEQWGTAYFSRYDKFQEVLSQEHPEIQLISSAGISSGGEGYDYAWERISSHNDDEIPYAVLVDEHYYNAPEWFLSNVSRYDAYDRESAGVFLGEYAAKSNTLYAAVAEAAYMTGLERNSDIVKMAAYAPLFGNLTQSQWSPDLIWFNNTTVFGSVNYYVQKLFAENQGDYTIHTRLDGNLEESAIRGRIGLGTWLTSAEFDDITVTDNKTGEVLYETDFTERGKDWISSGKGEWKLIEDDGNSVFAQMNTTYPNNNEIMGSAIYGGENSWTDYTFSCRAKKLGGAEGFLIPFAVKDLNNFYHWNLGGWGNTLSVIEQAQGGAKTNICPTVSMRIETGRWYDIQVKVAPDRIECYLDGKLIHSVQVEPVLPIYETASIDEETGDLILKLVNATEKNAQIHITLDTEPKGKTLVTVLGGMDKKAENTISRPEAVVPLTSELEIGKSFDYTAPNYSVTILRIPVR